MAQLMPLPLTVSCFSEIQIGFNFLVLAHPGSPGKRAVKRVCMCVHGSEWTLKYDEPEVENVARGHSPGATFSTKGHHISVSHE